MVSSSMIRENKTVPYVDCLEKGERARYHMNETSEYKLNVDC